MKILFLSTGHSIDDDRVGRKEAVSLARLGYEVIVCAQYNNRYLEPRVKFIDIDSVKYVDAETPLKKKRLGRISRCIRLRNLFRSYQKVKPDLVVAHEFESACLARWIYTHYGTPYVFDVHEAYEETIPRIVPKIFRPMIRILVRKEIKRIVRDASGITAAVPKVLAYQEAIRINKHSEILYNSPWLEYFPFSEIEKETILIVQEGNLSIDRGAFQILDALAIVKRRYKFKLVVIGSVVSDIAKKFYNRIAELSLEDYIEIKGFLPWDEFGQIEKDAQIGLCCLQQTHNCTISLACKIFTYSSCGLAIVGMKESETENYICDAQNGICVDTTNPDEISNAIIWLIEHPEERRQMARNGRKAIEERYCWERMEERIRKFYKQLFFELSKKRCS